MKLEAGPEHLIYMDWRTGDLYQFETVPAKADLQAKNLEHVYLCYHDASDSVFVDPISNFSDARYIDVDLLTLKEFRSTVRKLGAESLPLHFGEKVTKSRWTGVNHSKVVNATMKPENGLKHRMARLDAAIADLTETIEGLCNAK